MMRSMRGPLWVPSLLWACGPPASVPAPATEPDLVTATYWAALDTVSFYSGLHWERRDTIAVLNVTVPAGGFLFAELRAGEDGEEVARAIRESPPWLRRALAADVAPRAVPLQSSPSRTVVRVTDGDIERVFGPAGGAGDPWARWAERYPGVHGWIAFSAVFVDAAGEEATVYVELHCGPLCGSGLFVRLLRREGRWAAAEVMPVWAS